jgi:hypothetical protein
MPAASRPACIIHPDPHFFKPVLKKKRDFHTGKDWRRGIVMNRIMFRLFAGGYCHYDNTSIFTIFYLINSQSISNKPNHSLVFKMNQ